MGELLRVTDVSKAFVGRKRWRQAPLVVPAVNGVSFSLAAGETLALVGESGAGKTTLGRLTIRLVEPDTGSIVFQGQEITDLDAKALRRWRRHAQMVFQDPFTSLDPRKVVAEAINESFVVHGIGSADDRTDRIAALFDRVGIRPDQMDRYPHEFSGGQLQRIAIARALAPEPEFIVCDEPVAALDMSIRAQVLNLLRDLQDERGLAYLFVTHDLSLVRVVAHRVAVMYRGAIVELGEVSEIFAEPRHPYTRALLAAIPIPDPDRVRPPRELPEGIAPQTVTEGCPYAAFCPHAMEVCHGVTPELRDVEGVEVACHLYPPRVSGQDGATPAVGLATDQM